MLRKGLYITLVMSLVFGTAFFSGCRRHGHHRGAEFAVDYVSEVLDLTEPQQEQLNQQNKTRPVDIINHATFPKFNERENMTVSQQEYDLAKKAWVEENREEYDKIIADSNTLLTPSN